MEEMINKIGNSKNFMCVVAEEIGNCKKMGGSKKLGCSKKMRNGRRAG
jgi:hypothetical protein